MFIFVTCDVSPFAGFAWFLARAVLKCLAFEMKNKCVVGKIVIFQKGMFHKVCPNNAFY